MMQEQLEGQVKLVCNLMGKSHLANPLDITWLNVAYIYMCIFHN